MPVGTRGNPTTVQPDLANLGANGVYRTTIPSSGCPAVGAWTLLNTGWPAGTGDGNPAGKVLGRIERPTIMDWDRQHPVMRHVEFAKVTIEDALRMRPLAAGRPLVEAVGGPLMYALEEADRKAVYVGFDLFKTDFPLRVAFPVVLSNSLRWLHPADLDQASLQIAAGQPILLPVEHGIDTVTVATPRGRTVKAQVTRGVVSYADTDEVGLYTFTTARGDIRVAVNLMDAGESDVGADAGGEHEGLWPRRQTISRRRF